MSPGLNAGDGMFVAKWGYGNYGTYGFTIQKRAISRTLERGDIVIFQYPKNPSVKFVKRIIGLPMDEIEYSEEGLTVNGKKVARTFKGNDEKFALYTEKIDDSEYTIKIMLKRKHISPKGRISVPEGQFFVMGDNRDNSHDSRYWGFVPFDHIVGKVVYVIRANAI